MKPGVSELLIASATDAGLRRRLLESPDKTFADYNLTEEEKELLRNPDQRLLSLFASALAEQRRGSPLPPEDPAPQPQVAITGRTLPGMSLALTLAPCALYNGGKLNAFTYAVWVNPLAEGVDPATLPPPPGATLPGEPLTPLHAVIQVSAVQLPDHDGKPQVGLTASLRQSTNFVAPPPPESAGDPETSPFGSDVRATEVTAAVAEVRSANDADRYDKLIDLLHALKGGNLR